MERDGEVNNAGVKLTLISSWNYKTCFVKQLFWTPNQKFRTRMEKKSSMNKQTERRKHSNAKDRGPTDKKKEK